jgi:hypothetical protein
MDLDPGLVIMNYGSGSRSFLQYFISKIERNFRVSSIFYKKFNDLGECTSRLLAHSSTALSEFKTSDKSVNNNKNWDHI